MDIASSEDERSLDAREKRRRTGPHASGAADGGDEAMCNASTEIDDDSDVLCEFDEFPQHVREDAIAMREEGAEAHLQNERGTASPVRHAEAMREGSEALALPEAVAQEEGPVLDRQQEARGDIGQRNRRMEVERFGFFTISKTSAERRPPYGSLEASCPFHKLSATSSCKKKLQATKWDAGT